MPSIGDLTLRARVDNRRLDRDLRETENTTRRRMRSVGAIATRAVAGATAAVAALGGALVAVTNAAVNTFDEIAKGARGLDLTLNQFTELRTAFQLLGADAAQVPIVLSQVNRVLGQIATGQGEDARAQLDALGLTLRDFENLNTQQRFIFLANAIGELEDPARRAAAAQAFFGRSSRQIVGQLDDLGSAVERVRGVLPNLAPEVGRLAEELADVRTLAGTSVRLGFFSGILEGIVQTSGALDQASIDQSLREIAETAQDAGRFIGDFAGLILDNADSILEFFRSLGSLVNAIVNPLESIARATGTLASVNPGAGDPRARRSRDLAEQRREIEEFNAALARSIAENAMVVPEIDEGPLRTSVEAGVVDGVRAGLVQGVADSALTLQNQIDGLFSNIEIGDGVSEELLRGVSETTSALQAQVDGLFSNLEVGDTVGRELVGGVSTAISALQGQINGLLSNLQLGDNVSQELLQGFTEATSALQGQIDGLVANLGPSVQTGVGDGVREGLFQGIAEAAPSLQAQLNSLFGDIELGIQARVDQAEFERTDFEPPQAQGGSFEDFANNYVSGLDAAVSQRIDQIEFDNVIQGDTFTDRLQTIGQGFVGTLSSTLGSAISSGNWDSVGDALLASLTATFAQEFVGGVFSSLLGGAGGGLFSFHEGGVVPGPRGSERLALLEAGERVLTVRQQQQAGGNTVNVTLNATGDVTDATQRAILSSGRELAGIVAQQLTQQRAFA